jgi:NADH-quinone oxidoreductase subunit M
VPGALLGAAYMFRVSLKMAWGSPSGAGAWKDLNRREWSYLLLPAALTLVIGLAPGPFLRTIDPAVNKLLSDYRIRTTPAIVAVLDGSAAAEGMDAAKSAMELMVRFTEGERR